MSRHRSILPRLCILLLTTVLLAFPAMTYARNVADVLGASHVAGTYPLTAQDYLNEGASKLQQLGSRVIKVWLTHNPRNEYPFNSPNWPAAGSSLTTVAQTTYFRSLFQKSFSTFILLLDTKCGIDVRDGLSATEESCEYSEVYNLSRYLLQTYQNTGKTFVLQNWELDNKMLGNYSTTSVTGAKAFLSARQRAVNTARNELSTLRGVTLLHAAEVNLIQDAIKGSGRAVNLVLPGLQPPSYLTPDLYS